MKNEKLIYAMGSIVIIATGGMKILHVPGANAILIFSMVGMSVFQSWHVAQLKKRVKELEAQHLINKTDDGYGKI
jgi:hypothetical protein